jgi:hypothetical protein
MGDGAVGTAAREARRGDRRRRVVGTWAAVGTDNGMLTGGLSAERERLTGGSYMSVISELKFTPGRK